MLPARFELHRPRSIEAALALLERHGEEASPYAGGTELLIAMKARVLHFPHIVDVKRIEALRGIRALADGGLSIGALTSHHLLATDPLVRRRMPAYAALSGNIANARVRVAGTLGGNLCFAEPHADPPAFLCAVGAEVVLVDSTGIRRLPLADFLIGELATARKDHELLVSIEVPALPQGARAAYESVGHLERPCATLAVVAMPQARGYRWRFWSGAVSGKPLRLTALEAPLDGLPVADALSALERLAPDAASTIDAADDLNGSADYKRHLVAVLARRAARRAMEPESIKP